MKLFLSLLLLGPLLAGAQQSSYTIKGQGKSCLVNGSHVYLINQNGGTTKIDSALVKDGQYSFTGTMTQPGPVFLIDVPILSPAARLKEHGCGLYIEAGAISLSHVDSFSNVTVSGGPYNTAYAKLVTLLKPMINQYQSLMAEYGETFKTGDTTKVHVLQAALVNADYGIKSVLQGYARDNPASPIALFALESSVRGDIDPDSAGPIFKRFPESVKASAEGQAFQKKLESAGILNIGKTAPDFTQNDTLGKPISLSSFRGKYVLVDFWASWCGPCRLENPNVVAAFNKFKSKGFTILSISLDKPDAKDKWLAAIHKDGLIWTHVSDLKFWDNAVAKLYGINAIPQNFLLDPGGRIVAKGLRGEELEKRLGEIYK